MSGRIAMSATVSNSYTSSYPRTSGSWSSGSWSSTSASQGKRGSDNNKASNQHYP
jgi:hypothetical protein